MMLAFHNGRFVPSDLAALPPHDAGVVSGATVTDLVRTFRHRLFRLDDHLTRFRLSCERCRVPLTMADSDLYAAALELVTRNAHFVPPDGELGLVLLATPGQLGAYAGVPHDGPPTLLMHTFPLPLERYQPLFSKGARLVVPAQRRCQVIDPRAKQRSRMDWWLARQQARDLDPDADALPLDADGFVTETASANLIAVIDGRLFTPPAGTALDGISRRVVRELGFDVRDRRLTPEDCARADELLLTCTTWCVAGVASLDGRPVPWPGPTYRRVLKAYSALVGLDIAAQCGFQTD